MKESIGIKFMEETKYKYLHQSDQEREIPQPPLERTYQGEYQPIDLPKIEELEIKKVDLTQAIETRKSHRVYIEQSLTLKELTYLLWTTAGVKMVYENRATIRTVPSAGARHPFETYLLINNVEGLEPGLYRYLALSHQIVAVDLREGLKEEIMKGCLEQKFVATSAVTFIWVADAYRTTWRYVERGYRYMLLDAGHVCQNLYLVASAVNSGCCAIAAYDDDQLNEILGLDGVNDFVIYIATLGKIE